MENNDVDDGTNDDGGDDDGGNVDDDDDGTNDDDGGGNVRVLARVPGGRFGRPEERETRLDSRWTCPTFSAATLILSIIKSLQQICHKSIYCLKVFKAPS